MYEQQYNPYAGNIAVVKKYFGGPRILILGILYAVSAFLNLVLIATDSSTSYMTQMIRYIFNEMGTGVPSEVYDALNTASDSATVSTIFSGIIIPMVMALAFILMFVKSRSASDRSTPMAGLTIMFVFAIINFVTAIILVAVIGIAYAIILVAGLKAIDSYNSYSYSYSSGSSSSVIAGLVIAGVILAIFCFVYLFYAISYKNFYRSARRSLRSVSLENKGATAYGVFCIIMAVFSLIGLIGTIIISSAARSALSYYGGYYGNYYSSGMDSVIVSSVLTSGLSIVTLIFTAIVAIGYSSHINSARYNINSSPYAYGQADNAYAPAYNNPAAGYSDNYGGYQNDATVYCPNCGTPASASEAYCPNCGTRL